MAAVSSQVNKGAFISPGTPLCTVSDVVEITGRERNWDVFMQIEMHSSTGSMPHASPPEAFLLQL